MLLAEFLTASATPDPPFAASPTAYGKVWLAGLSHTPPEVAERYSVKFCVVPESSERCTTEMAASGRVTPSFSAAMAGAPVANMTSAYGGIRWGSGLARAFQYEKTQSRIGKSIWDAPNLYIENSPLFWLPRVTTPLFIMSNDKDDAVPWYQGIELFVGMRRLGKEVYLVDYNDDVHNPAGRANQKDVALKMQQFFDSKLMGKPAPDWMTKGIPAKDKGRDQIVMAPAPASTTAPAPRGGGN